MAVRHFIAVTPAQLNAIREALNSRLAGPIEQGDGMNLPETYEVALAETYKDRVGEVAVLLSMSEFCALRDALSGREPDHLQTRKCLNRAVQKLKDTPR